MASPRELAMDLVNAQQARRALDYLVGFNLSPLCWKKIRPGLSAGRVQSPALRMIAERELEIAAFTPREYWTIHADVLVKDADLRAKLIIYEGEKLDQFLLVKAEQANEAVVKIEAAANGEADGCEGNQEKAPAQSCGTFYHVDLATRSREKAGFSTQKTMQMRSNCMKE